MLFIILFFPLIKLDDFQLNVLFIIMLFLTHRPTNLILTNHHQLILTTPNQIIFTTLQFLQEFLSKHLAHPHPTLLAYSDIRSQAVAGSQEAIQLYWTDWAAKIELRCLVMLNQEPIYAIVCQPSWIIYGDFKQYSPNQLKLTRIHSYDDEFFSCFLGETQYILTNKRLVAYNHRAKKLAEIEWHDRDAQLSKVKEKMKVEMKAFYGKYGWICIAIENLCILVREQKVEATIIHEGKLYVSEDVLMWIDHGSCMCIYQICQENLLKLGEMETFQGHYLGCTLSQSNLIMIFYDFRELQVKNVRLVNEEENIEYEAKKKQKERLKSAMKTSIQQPYLEGIPFNPSTQPQQNKQGIKLNLSGNIQRALKASIQKFQSSFDKSFEQVFQPSKYNEQIQIQSDTQHQIDQIRASNTNSALLLQKPIEDMSKIEPISPADSSGRAQGQGSEIFEWQKMESNYEQHLESSDVVKGICQNSSHSHPSQKSRHSQQSNQNYLNNNIGDVPFEYAQTPAFNTLDNHHWDEVNKSWDAAMSPQFRDPIVEVSRSSKNASDSKNSSSILLKNTQNQRYTQILSEIYRKQPQNFDQALQTTMGKVIQQNEARIFFADHIRILNPSLTRDRLLRLYRHVDDNEENRRLMAKALSEFRLQEVPYECLPIKGDILKVFQKIYPSVYVEDLLEPNIRLLEELIESYFSKKFTHQTLQIQDETIQLVHSRNLLNILLYTNENYDLPLENIFEIYIKKMIRHQQATTLKRIIDSEVCDICGISRAFFEKVVQHTIKEILDQSGAKNAQIQESLILFSPKTRKTMTNILTIIDYLQKFKIKFKVDDIFNVPQSKHSQKVIRGILDNCSTESLTKISLPYIFQSFTKISQEKSTLFYEPWQISISKQIAQTLFKQRYFKDAATILLPLSPVLKRSFVVKLLIKYLQGKFANKFACSLQNPAQIIDHIFRMILENPFKQLQGDIPPSTQDDPEWMGFLTMCKQKYHICWELSYILYNDKVLGRQLVYQQMLTMVQYEQLTNLLNNKRPKSNTIPFLNLIPMVLKQVQIPLAFDVISQHTNESAQINQSLSPKSSQPRLLLQQSFRGYDVKNDTINEDFNRSVRYNDTSTDPALIMLKLCVQKQSILSYLKEIYEEYPIDKFIEALGMIDREKVTLHHVELFKTLSNTEIAYDFQKIIPFQYFLDCIQLAWMKVRDQVISQINHENFWVIYLLVDIIYQKSHEIAEAFIQRVICYEMDDQWHRQIGKMLTCITIEESRLRQLRNQAQQRNLTKILKILDQKMQ